MSGIDADILVHRADAEVLRVARRGEADRPPSKFDVRRAIGGIDAGHDLDQRRLAGAVVAEQAVHFAGIDVDADIVEREIVAEDCATRFASAHQGSVHQRLCFLRLSAASRIRLLVSTAMTSRPPMKVGEPVGRPAGVEQAEADDAVDHACRGRCRSPSRSRPAAARRR